MGVAIVIDPFQASSLWPFVNIKTPCGRHSIKSLSSPEKGNSKIDRKPKRPTKTAELLFFRKTPFFSLQKEFDREEKKQKILRPHEFLKYFGDFRKAIALPGGFWGSGRGYVKMLLSKGYKSIRVLLKL